MPVPAQAAPGPVPPKIRPQSSGQPLPAGRVIKKQDELKSSSSSFAAGPVIKQRKVEVTAQTAAEARAAKEAETAAELTFEFGQARAQCLAAERDVETTAQTVAEAAEVELLSSSDEGKFSASEVSQEVAEDAAEAAEEETAEEESELLLALGENEDKLEEYERKLMSAQRRGRGEKVKYYIEKIAKVKLQIEGQIEEEPAGSFSFVLVPKMGRARARAGGPGARAR